MMMFTLDSDYKDTKTTQATYQWRHQLWNGAWAYSTLCNTVDTPKLQNCTGWRKKTGPPYLIANILKIP